MALYIPTYTSSLGYSALTGSLVLATFNFVCFIGTISSQLLEMLKIAQIVLGYLCSKVPYLQVMLYSSLFSSIAAFTLLGFAGSLPLVFVFVVVFGSLVFALFVICRLTSFRQGVLRQYGPKPPSTRQPGIQLFEVQSSWPSAGHVGRPPLAGRL